ncbi:MAG: hypothetical protein Q7T03_04325 [Deltaproteobacteria bacterium]|nr:hypothetical protein [Deltaproteobacteria bacterium]
MKIKKLLLIVTGFVAGIAFISACGSGSGNGVGPLASIAATIGNAVDVVFSNGKSKLTATNVQDALDEVDGRVDTLEAKNGIADLSTTLIGTWTGKTYIGKGIFSTHITFKSDKTFTCGGNITADPNSIVPSSGPNALLQDGRGVCIIGGTWQAFHSTVLLIPSVISEDYAALRFNYIDASNMEFDAYSGFGVTILTKN